jgi:hypothetical protein
MSTIGALAKKHGGVGAEDVLSLEILEMAVY